MLLLVGPTCCFDVGLVPGWGGRQFRPRICWRADESGADRPEFRPRRRQSEGETERTGVPGPWAESGWAERPRGTSRALD